MDLSKFYPPRPDWVHKGHYGSLLVIAGSKFYSGSATLAGVSAVRTGCDLVTVVAPHRAADVASHTLPDLISYPLRGDYLSSTHVKEISDVVHLRKINAVVIGCGLGRAGTTMTAVQKLITKMSVPIVLDADALIALAQKPEIGEGKHFVLTPHAGELSTLLGGEEVGQEFEHRMALAKKAAQKYKSVVLLKGHLDIITDGQMAVTNNTGSPQMTKGGFGDTLAGIVGTLLSRGAGLFEAAHIGAYINGVAGSIAADYKGEGVAASDIFEYLPQVVKAS